MGEKSGSHWYEQVRELETFDFLIFCVKPGQGLPDSKTSEHHDLETVAKTYLYFVCLLSQVNAQGHICPVDVGRGLSFVLFVVFNVGLK